MIRTLMLQGLIGLVIAAPLYGQAFPERSISLHANAVIAYVSSNSFGAGKLSDSKVPFSSIPEALAAGANEIRIVPGVYEGDLNLSNEINLRLRTWNGRAEAGEALDEPGELEILGDVTIDGGATVALASPGILFRIRGNVILVDGVLDITGHTLEMEASKVVVGKRGELRSSSQCFPPEEAMRFTGDDLTEVFVETTEDQLRFDFPAIEVEKTGNGRVTFNANGVLSTATGDVPANRPDILGACAFTLISGRVELLDGLDVFDVRGQYEQYDGEFLMAGISSIGGVGVKPYRQKVMVGFELEPGNMIIEDGEFFAGNSSGAGAGGDVEVFGDFCLGCTPPATNGAASKLAAEPSSGLFSLAINGTHTVLGDFTVGPDLDPSEQPDQDTDARNRYFLGGECGVLPNKGGLFVNGNYHFEGTGDRFDDLSWLTQQQGLHGNVFFTGPSEQTVWHRQDEDAFFCDVVMATRSEDNTGILLLSNGWQNDEGTLTLEHGIIDTDDGQWDWIIQNPGFETDLAGRNNSARGTGVVDLGSRDSYVNGEVDRRVETGNATGGVITGGYLFPVGIEGEEVDDGPVGTRDVDFFRPLILQFPDDLGRSSLARVNYVGGSDVGDDRGLSADSCEWPDGGLIVDAVGGGTVELDVVSNQFWRLEFDPIPSFDPNVRVEADEMPNIFDIKSLRLIQWDCDCTNPRLAGLYDLNPGNENSAAISDFIASVPNITQEGVDVEGCQIIGIASNFLINPINIPELPSGLAKVQLIHNVPDAPFPIDVYVDGNRIWNDATFQTATPFIPMAGGTHTVDLVAGDDGDNSSPIFSQELTVFNEINYVVVAHGLVNPGVGEPPLKLVIEDGVRLQSTDEESIDFFFIHGAPRLGQVDIRELDPVTNNTVIGLLANNLTFGSTTGYLALDPTFHNLEVSAEDTRQSSIYYFDLSGMEGQTLVLTVTGTPDSLALDAFDIAGTRVQLNRVNPLSVDPSTLDFGEVFEGETATLPVTVSHIGSDSLDVISIFLEGANPDLFEVDTTSFTLAPGISRTLHVSFMSSETGSFSASLVFLAREFGVGTVSLTATVNSLEIEVTPTDAPKASENLGIAVSTSGFAPAQRQLFYRRGGEASYDSVALNSNATGFTGTIPADFVTERGLDYYVVFADEQITATFPETNPAENPAHLRVRVDQLPAAVDLPSLTYHMVSVPLELDDTQLSAILEDDYSAYDATQWRLFRWDADQEAYREFPDLAASFTPGTAFWLNTRTGIAFDVEDGLSVDATGPYPVTLRPGWNQIATPFAFPIAWSSVTGNEQVEAPVAYDGSQYHFNQSLLQPWQGYFVFNPTGNPIALSFPAVEAAETAGKDASSPPIVAEASYVVRLNATVPGYGLRDSENYLGFNEQASEGRDGIDFADPPGIGSYLRLSFIEAGEPLAGSFKPVGGEGRQWEVELAVVIEGEVLPTRKEVQVVLEEHGERPTGFAVYVLDEDFGRAVEVVEGVFSVEVSPSHPVRHLQVIVGTKSYAEEHSEAVPLEVLEDALSQNYPNPFNPETVIGYVLSERQEVELAIYDVLGRRVRVLVRGEQEAGRYEAVWDGRGDAGVPVASGVYVYRLEAGSFRATRRLLLLH